MFPYDHLLDSVFPTVLEHWKWLHAHPELSGQEQNTAAYVAEQLRKLGLEPTERVGGWGVTAMIQGAHPGKCLALRADMDALPIQEETGVPFASTVPGVMHACGHDAHTAMLLGVAQMLCQLRDQIHGSVKLVFQPSEEVSDSSGAKRMIADGVLENPKVDAIIGQHVNASRDLGDVSIRTGAISAASDRFFITVHGKSCHAARPSDGTDAIVLGAQVITALQSIVSRNVRPLDSSVLTIGKVSAGSRYNVVADTFEMEGTCRNLNPAIREFMPQRMEDIIRGITQGMGGDYTFRYVKGYSPTINDPDMTQLVRDVATEVATPDMTISTGELGMGGEDFSFYAEQVPACFFRVGCHKVGAPKIPQHNAHFLPEEKTLYFGSRIMLASALRYLSGE